MKCRHCAAKISGSFLDLGFSPPSNAYLQSRDLMSFERYFPLKVGVCEDCWLVQTEDYAAADELFSSDYAYFSSTSLSWLRHAKDYVQMITKSMCLDAHSMVVEIASNDGYLLKNFVDMSIPCLGIEPTDSTASAAESLGVPVIRKFFSEELANILVRQGNSADLICANNVYAHVPDINDFTRGLKTLLKADGVVTIEFPHLLELMKNSQFDTVYHEHFSYLSLNAVKTIFSSAGLKVWRVEEIETHGGSLRIYGGHQDTAREIESSVAKILIKEYEYGLQSIDVYKSFQEKVDVIKNNLVKFLITQREEGAVVVAYGAAAKGNTLLNYGGIKPDLLHCVFDAAQSKQGKYMPGSHIPILSPSLIEELKPNFVLILPWNLSTEILKQLSGLKKYGTKFIVAVPELKIIS